MPASYRKPKPKVPLILMTVACPSCGRHGKAPKGSKTVRCSECGKEFKPGEGGIARTIVLIVLALVVMAGIMYFAVSRATRLDAEDKAKAAVEERQRQAAQSLK
jgi:LSD1 subclass zinc finger protein